MSKFLKDFVEKFSLFVAKATFVFILVIVVILIGFANFFGNTKQIADQSTFSVQGTAEREIVPDRALIYIGTYVEGKNPADIQKIGNEKINKALAAIKKLGIEDKNVKTADYTLSPRYNYVSGVNKIDGYVLNISIEVKIDGVDQSTEKVSDVISTAQTVGLEEVRSLNFEVTNRNEIIEELKLEAVEDAKDKVSSIESSSGLKLGKIKTINFSDTPSYVPGYYGEDRDGAGSPTKDDGGVNIQTGETKITTTVTIIYEVL